MKVLTIGNSYAGDATRYLHEIAALDGQAIKTVNLFIGGCSLAMHYKNMNNDSRNYLFEFNGHSTGIYVSLREALQSDDWDYVTMHQVSTQSIRYDTFQPYLKAISDYVAFHAPKAKRLLSQTWAYKANTPNLCEALGYKAPFDMFKDVKAAYAEAARETGFPMIPGGEALMGLVREGMENVYRDALHASLGLGRYTLALTWYGFLTGRPLPKGTPCFDEPVTEAEIQVALRCAERALAGK